MSATIVDRGPDSAGVVESPDAALNASEPRNICLMGNHDQMFVETHRRVVPLDIPLAGARRRRDAGELWPDPRPSSSGSCSTAAISAKRSRRRTPQLSFAGSGPLQVRYRRLFLRPCGNRPGSAAGRPGPARPACGSATASCATERDHGAVVVHGHTPVRRLDVQLNRVGIDTAAVFGGRLTCVVFEGVRKGQLTPDGHGAAGLSARVR